MVFFISRFRADLTGELVVRSSFPTKDRFSSCSIFFVNSSATFRTISFANSSTLPFIICFKVKMVFKSSRFGSSFFRTSGSVRSSVILYFSSAWRSITSTVCFGNSFLTFCSQEGTISLLSPRPPARSSCRMPCSSPYSLEYRKSSASSISI